MKRKLAFALTVMLVVSVFSAAAAYTTMYVYTSNGNPLNMRDAPGMYGNIMIQIPNGAAVWMRGAYDPTWYSVTYSGYTGYCMSRYLVYGTPTPTYCPEPTPGPYDGAFPNEIFYGFQSVYYKALVRPGNPAGYVNLRWAPSLQAEIHSRYYANAMLTVMSQNSLWCQVLDENGNIMGYILRQFLYPYYSGGGDS